MKLKFLTLTPILFFAASLHAVVLDRVMAVVGQQPILQSEIQKRKEQLSSSKVLASIYGMDPSQITTQSLQEAMIEEKVIEAATQELDMRVSDADVEKQIDSIAKMNGVDRKALEASLQSQNIPLEGYKTNIRLQLQRQNIMGREIRKGGGSDDAEVRELYLKRARPQHNLWILDVPLSEQSALLKKHRSQKVDFATLKEKYSSTALGWTDTEALLPDFRNALKGADSQALVGPVAVSGQKKLLYVEGARVGSEEEYQQVKDQLRAEAQAMDYEKRFQFWLEKKKREMHIVVNKP